jgi:hypothetical protein
MENENTLIPAGTYQGTVVDYGINETKKGMPQIFIQFNLTELNKKLTWFGSVANDKAIEITGQALIRCGFKKTDFAVLANGKASGELDMGKSLNLVVEHNTWEGKTSAKIAWVNELGGPQNKLDQAGAVQKLAGLNISGKMIQLQQEMGIQNEPVRPSHTPSQQEQQGTSAENIPF